MTNPFETTVGLKGVTTTEAPIWINDISGMSTELVAAVADSEDYSTDDTEGVAATWNRVRRLGLNKLLSMMEGELSKSADFQYVSERSGELTGEPTGIVLLPAAIYSGFSVTAAVDRNSQLHLGSMTLDSVSEEPVETVIKVFSARGKELFTKNVTVEHGRNLLVIDTAIRSEFGRNVIAFVGIDVSELPLSTLGSGQEFGCNDLVPASILVSSDHNLGDHVIKSATGVMLEATVRRSLSDVVVRYADRLGWCYAHIVASMLMTEKLASSNVNLFTNTNRLFTEEMETRLMTEAKTQLLPVTRTMIKDLRSTPAMQPDSEFQQGYFNGSFV